MPRAVIAHTEISVLACPIAVRLLDISVSGVLLESSRSVDLGSRGTLRLNFAGLPLSAEIEIERAALARTPFGAESFSIGATFVALSRENQRVIERFSER